MNVLITGASGFIGRRLVNYFLEKNFKVRVLVRDTNKITLLPNQVNVVHGDLIIPSSLTGICDNIDAVFHLGGYAHDTHGSNLNFIYQHYTNTFLGTQHIVNEAIRARVKKFIFFSSVKAVGEHEESIDETMETPPDSPYGMAKRQAEELVLAAKLHMHVCVLRPALVYGPEWKGNLSSMWNAIKRGVFPPLPDTGNRRSLISIDDLCQAAWLAAIQTNAHGKYIL